MKAGGAGTASWGKGRDEIRDHTDQESHRERSASFGLSAQPASLPGRGGTRSARCFNRILLPRWGHYSLEWGRTSLGSLSRHPLARPGPQQGRAPWESKVQPGWGGKDKPGTWPESALGVGGRCGRGLNLALPGAVEAKNSP